MTTENRDGAGRSAQTSTQPASSRLPPVDATDNRWSAPAYRPMLVFLLALLLLGALGWLPFLAHLQVGRDRFPLFSPQARMSDLTIYGYKALYRSGVIFGGPGPTFNYPAPAALVYAGLLHFYRSVRAFKLAFLVTLGTAAVVGFALLRGRGRGRLLAMLCWAVVLVVGSPHWFALDRGNLEIFGWLCSFLALCAFGRKRFVWAAVLMGAAIAMKPFPIVLLFLFLYRGRWKNAALALLCTAALILGSLHLLGPSIAGAYQGLRFGVADYVVTVAESLKPTEQYRFDHALMASVRLVLQKVLTHRYPGLPYGPLVAPGLPAWARLDYWLAVFAAIGAVVGTATLFLARRRGLLAQVMLLSIVSTMLPPVSNEYTLLALYAPVVLLLRSMCSAEGRRWSTEHQHRAIAIMLLLAVLIVPISLETAEYSGVVKALALVALWVLFATTGRADHRPPMAELAGS